MDSNLSISKSLPALPPSDSESQENPQPLADQPNIPLLADQPSLQLPANPELVALPPQNILGVRLCDGSCQRYIKVYICVLCDGGFCDDCWPLQFPHKPGRLGPDGLPHERTDLEVVERLRGTLDISDRTPQEQQELHKSDEDTAWFGIARDEADMPIFQDYGRYAAILAEPQANIRRNRYPQLVSFIGQTGAGKSTLIKILIDKEEKSANARLNGARFPSPITSLANSNLPTSGDVHLYSDPATCGEACPMMYADCEGMEGGENVPQGARFKLKDGVATPSSLLPNASHNTQFRRLIRRRAGNLTRDLAWATNPDSQKREYAVTQLYPRLLYTFSDTVVYVLKNSKSFESAVLGKLLKWASSSIEKSVNQPTLPHLIIVLNATEVVPQEALWDTNQATKEFMRDIAGAVHRDPEVRATARDWSQRKGRRIENTEELLKCFYSTTTVIRIPAKGRYMLLENQVTKLRQQILGCCQASLETKNQVRMLATGEKLQLYLQSAFDHFSQDLDTPFDFIKEAIKINPLPRDFAGNIVKLAIAIKDHSHFTLRADIPRIFNELSYHVASCIVLDSIRQGLPGTPATLFKNYYSVPCFEALNEFKEHWPCGFSNKGGTCALTEPGHASGKGHQNFSGKIIGSGGYQSDFNLEKTSIEWNDMLVSNIAEIQRELESKRKRAGKDRPYDDDNEQAIAAEVHSARSKTFFDRIGNVSQFISHLACFSCLRELPEHPLKCGHVLCTPCVEAYGYKPDKSIIKLKCCPLHPSNTRWATPWEINIKPRYAGVRILSLDGGGVRGIVELEVLRAIEEELGGNLHIQAFFDLMVGTSTGGIIALGLGVQHWPLEKCIEKFVTLAEKAFQPQKGINTWGLSYLATLIHKGKYRTRPFEKALQEEFGEKKPLFGGENSVNQFKIKVAVTSTTNVESEPVVLTNYNRPEPSNPQYRFERSDYPEKGLCIWETARATSAAPPYFKCFTDPHTNQGYLDGAFYHNNPVWVAFREHQLIWSDISSLHPDILLSIGTGRAESPSPKSVDIQQIDPKTYTEQIWSTVDSSLKHLLNCDKRWTQFSEAMIQARGSEGTPRNYIRMNVRLDSAVPPLDAIQCLSALQKEVQEILHDNKKATEEIAHRLVASTFFFEKERLIVREGDCQFACEGRICCRFTNSSKEMKGLGRYLSTFLTEDSTPYFLVCEPKKYSMETSAMIPISRKHIDIMTEYGAFDPVSVDLKVATLDSESMIALCLRQGDYRLTFSPKVYWDPDNYDDIAISGFPRKLFTEDTLAKKNFRGLVSRIDDPYVDSKISIVNRQLSHSRPRDSDLMRGLFGPTVS